MDLENTNCIAPNSKMHFLNILWRKLSNFFGMESFLLLLLNHHDASARAMLLNGMQYNGTYGLHYCEHPGVSVKGDGHVWVFPSHFRPSI
jgi:hypothetical protein